MTDTEALEMVLTGLDPEGGALSLVRKKGRVLLALPSDRQAAMRTLQLYQPQRTGARAFGAALGFAIRCGVHPIILSQLTAGHGQNSSGPAFPEVLPGSVGIMLGSPEHRVRRAIASFQTRNGLEVAKIAFGQGGLGVISGEAAALEGLPPGIPGVPKVLGTYHGDEISMMRMPYFQGRVVDAGDYRDAVAMLDSWISSESPVAIDEFPEWKFIESALSARPGGQKALEWLRRFQLVPTIGHGDFARWNLIRTHDGGLVVLDWEWAVPRGMPGMDLVHYFAQDARLVDRLSPREIVRSVEASLQRSECRSLLQRTGWNGSTRSMILASIAYTVGTKQQANGEVLAELLTCVQ